MPNGRYILHVDMDAFYASIEVLDNPSLKGKPVIVGGDAKSRGVVAAASYEVRKFGVHSAMPMAKAVRLCPQAVILPVRMSRYVEVSHQIREIFDKYTTMVEPVSVDEAFLDVTDSARLYGGPEMLGRRIQTEIGESLNSPLRSVLRRISSWQRSPATCRNRAASPSSPARQSTISWTHSVLVVSGESARLLRSC
jgi:DNA polymerase IV